MSNYELFEQLHKEENANILVFITHHTKNDSFIEDSLINLMLPFEKLTPITLKKDCVYYNQLEEIVKDIKQDVLENKNPKDERSNNLIEKDKFENKQKHLEYKDDEVYEDEKTIQFIKAFRTIEISGQIIKNRKGSLSKDNLKLMLNELYNTGFRMMSGLSDIIEQLKTEISNYISEKITTKDTKIDIELRINKYLQLLSLYFCINIFSKFVTCAGVRELRELYLTVAKEIDSPASKIISFSINSYYGKIDLKELETLAKEFKDNIVALSILKSLVQSYIYNNNIHFREKQKIASYLNMQISATAGKEHNN